MTEMCKKRNLMLAVINTLTMLIWLVNVLLDMHHGQPMDVSAMLLTVVWGANAVLWWMRWSCDKT